MGLNGQRVGRYILSKELGVGMFSKVFLATDCKTNASYAVKVMRKDSLEELEMAKYARREAAILRKLSHPNVVKFIEAIQSDTKLFLVMELVPGVELLDVVSAGRLPEPIARIYISQIIEAVSYLHSRGIVHRDLKPDNVLVDADSQSLKLIDFGLTGLTRSNALMKTSCGSCYYSAPEVTFPSGDGYNGAKADAWSVGILSYILLTASHPFVDGDGELLTEALKRGDVEYPADLSAEATHFLGRLLTADARKRYSTAQAGLHPWVTGCTKQSGESAAGNLPISKRPDTFSVPNDRKSILNDRENASSPSLAMRRRSSQRQSSGSFLWFRRNRVPSTGIPASTDALNKLKKLEDECVLKPTGQTQRRVKRRGSLDRKETRVTFDMGNNRMGHESIDGSPVRRQPSISARTRALLRTPFLAASVQT